MALAGTGVLSGSPGLESHGGSPPGLLLGAGCGLEHLASPPVASLWDLVLSCMKAIIQDDVSGRCPSSAGQG